MNKLFVELLKGHAEAIELCQLVFVWANDYDHLVDGDKTPDTQEVLLHRAMWAMLEGLHRNRFYRAHQDELLVTLMNGVSTWRISNTLQRAEGPIGHQLAHVLRWAPIEFFLHCARLVAGEDWVQEVGPRFWIAMTQDHSFEEFARECAGG